MGKTVWLVTGRVERRKLLIGSNIQELQQKEHQMDSVMEDVISFGRSQNDAQVWNKQRNRIN